MENNNILITSDLHLTDNPMDEYRWKVFDEIARLVGEHNVGTVLILGDITDRKDRHSAVMINRLVSCLLQLGAVSGKVFCLMGNHDAPLTGVPYLKFLDSCRVIDYVTIPRYEMGIGWLLPYSSDPFVAWNGIDLSSGPAIFMHQTVDGALIEGNRILSAPSKLPMIPRGIPIYSGDVHRPQKVGPVTYVGAPYPVDFNENWANRMLLIKERDFKNPVEVPICLTRRRILDIVATSDLVQNSLVRGDQVKIRYHFQAARIEELPMVENEIRSWSSETGVQVVSLENILEEKLTAMTVTSDQTEEFRPDEIVRLYGEDRKLSNDLVNFGVSITREVKVS